MGALVIYDITKVKSFYNVLRWSEELMNNASENIKIMLVGNKLDLVMKTPTLREVSKEEGMKLAEKYGFMFEETSAFTSENVNMVF